MTNDEFLKAAVLICDFDKLSQKTPVRGQKLNNYVRYALSRTTIVTISEI